MPGTQPRVVAGGKPTALEASALLPRYSSRSYAPAENAGSTSNNAAHGADPSAVDQVIDCSGDFLCCFKCLYLFQQIAHAFDACRLTKTGSGRLMMLPTVQLWHSQMESQNSTPSLYKQHLMERLYSKRLTAIFCPSSSAWLSSAALTEVTSHNF